MKTRLSLLGLLVWLLPASAWAACLTTSTLTVKDGSSTSQTFCIGGSAGQLLSNTEIVDSTGANPLSIGATGAAAVNQTQLGGNTISTAASGVQKVGIVGSTNAAIDGAASGATVANAVQSGAQYNSTQPSPSSGQTVAVQADSNGGVRTSGACNKVINISQTTTTDIKTMTKFGKICSIVLVSASAQNIGIVEGTGTLCATGRTSLVADSAGVPQMPLPPNGGFTATASQPWLSMQATADHLCLEQSGSGVLAGVITYIDNLNL